MDTPSTRSARPRARPPGLVPDRPRDHLRGGEGHLVRHPEEPHGGAGRRIRQRQIGDLARDPRTPAARELDHRQGQRDRLRRTQRAAARSGRAPQIARRRHLDDLPGADDLAQPRVHLRLPADRSAAAAHGDDRRAGAQARAGAAGRGRHSRSGIQDQRLPVADVGRTAAAGDDRDGDRLRAEAPHRRRADHRARRHDPEADPRPHRCAAEEAPDVGAVHHARPRGGRRHRRRRRRDAQRRDPRAGPGDAAYSRTRRMPTRRRC